MNSPTRSLILAGGGMRVAYQAGVIKALEDYGITYTHIDGTSGGTINLAMMLSGLTPAQMCEQWRTLNVKSFAAAAPIGDFLKGPNMLAVGSAKGIVNDVFPHLGVDVDKIRRSTAAEGTFNVCNFTQKTAVVIPHREIDLDLLIAGISLPIFMPPVSARGQLWTDAVWIKDANLMEAVRRGADEIWLVWCIGNTPTYFKGAFRQYVHMIEMSANGALNEEIARIKEINDRIALGERPYGRTTPVVLHVIKPLYALPLDPDFFLGRIDAQTLIDTGYGDAARYLEGRHVHGVPLNSEATKMQDEPNGVSFREVMTGNFALGATDAKAGAAKGKAEGTTMALHANIGIRDIDHFIADPEHMSPITGAVDFTPWGNGMSASKGQFKLFCPSGTPKLWYMVYELAFMHAGKPYYLAGKKHVSNDAGFDMLSDTTTLYTMLHEGSDTTGNVVGAGVLKLNMVDFAKILTTVRPTGTDSVADGAKTVAKFGQFFTGQLTHIYGPGVGHLLPKFGD